MILHGGSVVIAMVESQAQDSRGRHKQHLSDSLSICPLMVTWNVFDAFDKDMRTGRLAVLQGWGGGGAPPWTPWTPPPLILCSKSYENLDLGNFCSDPKKNLRTFGAH